jgi:signal transduction histidine kinase
MKLEPIIIIEASVSRYANMLVALEETSTDWPHTRFAELSDAREALSHQWSDAQIVPALIILSVTPDITSQTLEQLAQEIPFNQSPMILVLPKGVTVPESLRHITIGSLPQPHEDVSCQHLVSGIENLRQLSSVEETIDLRIHPILLVTNDGELAAQIEEVLLAQAPHMRLRHADNSSDGLDLFTEHEFSTVLLDVTLEDDDGFIIFECMQADPIRGKVPIVMLVDEVDAEFTARAVQVGWPHFLPKVSLGREDVLIEMLESLAEREQTTNALRSRLDHQRVQNKMLRRQRDHLQRELSRLAEALQIANSNLRYEVAIRDDLAEKLRTADRLATVGRLARGLASVINNPLSYAIGNLELCRQLFERELGETLQEAITDRETLATLQEVLKEFDLSMRDALDGLERVGRVASDLSRFSRIPEDQFTSINPREILETVVQLMSSEFHATEVHSDFNSTPTILAQRAGLVQIFTNILMHINDLGSGSSLYISTHEVSEQARIVIEDRSTQIAPHAFERIFEPTSFEDSAQEDTSTDVLSLPLVYHLVQELGGEIDVESKLGYGLRFTLHFPSYKSLSSEAVMRITGQYPKVTLDS